MIETRTMRFKRPNGRNGQKGNEETIAARYPEEERIPRRNSISTRERARSHYETADKRLGDPGKGPPSFLLPVALSTSAHLSERMDDRKKWDRASGFSFSLVAV